MTNTILVCPKCHNQRCTKDEIAAMCWDKDCLYQGAFSEFERPDYPVVYDEPADAELPE